MPVLPYTFTSRQALVALLRRNFRLISDRENDGLGDVARGSGTTGGFDAGFQVGGLCAERDAVVHAGRAGDDQRRARVLPATHYAQESFRRQCGRADQAPSSMAADTVIVLFTASTEAPTETMPFNIIASDNPHVLSARFMIRYRLALGWGKGEYRKAGDVVKPPRQAHRLPGPGIEELQGVAAIEGIRGEKQPLRHAR